MSNGMVERGIGTLKRILKKIQNIEQKAWTTLLPDAVKTYNNTYKQVINNKPATVLDMTDEVEIRALRDKMNSKKEGKLPSYEKEKNELKVGDTVRTKDFRKDKNTPNWKQETSKVIRVSKYHLGCWAGCGASISTA